MRIVATIDALTMPTSDLGRKCFNAISGALISYTASGTLSTAVIGSVFSAATDFNDPDFSHSPRTRLINAITFASITALVDHYLPIHRVFSYTACAAFFYVTNQEAAGQIPLIAGTSIVLPYVPSLINKIFRYSIGIIKLPNIVNWTSEVILSQYDRLVLLSSSSSKIANAKFVQLKASILEKDIDILSMARSIGELAIGPIDIDEFHRSWENAPSGFSFLAIAIGTIICQVTIISAIYHSMRDRQPAAQPLL
jgi:hypothetical protein